MTEINITLEHYLDVVLRCRPYVHIKVGDDIHNTLSPLANSPLFVMENEEWPVGYNNQLLPKLADGMIRLWNKADWDICDNRRRQAIATIEHKQQSYRERMATMREAVKQDMMSKGITEVVWGMLSATMTDSQVEMMFGNIRKD